MIFFFCCKVLPCLQNVLWPSQYLWPCLWPPRQSLAEIASSSGMKRAKTELSFSTVHIAQCLEIRDRPILENDLERNANLYRFDLIKSGGNVKIEKNFLTMNYVFRIHYKKLDIFSAFNSVRPMSKNIGSADADTDVPNIGRCRYRYRCQKEITKKLKKITFFKSAA